MNIIDTIIEQAKASAATLIEQGWEGSGSAYDVGTYHGDAEALAERLGRPTTREERVSLEHQIRRILDERMTDHTPASAPTRAKVVRISKSSRDHGAERAIFSGTLAECEERAEGLSADVYSSIGIRYSNENGPQLRIVST